MIRLGKSQDGRLVLGSSEPFERDIRLVEYYRDQRLFNLLFEEDDSDGLLMPCEIDAETAAIVQASPNIMVIAMAEPGVEPYGYAVPLVQIGV